MKLPTLEPLSSVAHPCRFSCAITFYVETIEFRSKLILISILMKNIVTSILAFGETGSDRLLKFTNILIILIENTNAHYQTPGSQFYILRHRKLRKLRFYSLTETLHSSDNVIRNLNKSTVLLRSVVIKSLITLG